MKTVVLLTILFCALLGAQVQPGSGFTLSTQPVSQEVGVNRSEGAIVTKQGIVVTFHSDDPTVTAFIAEVGYTLPGSMVPVVAYAYAMKNGSGDGTAYLWVGTVANVAATGYEIKTFGRWQISR